MKLMRMIINKIKKLSWEWRDYDWKVENCILIGILCGDYKVWIFIRKVEKFLNDYINKLKMVKN